MKHILVIEDNLEIRENICEILEIAGYKVSFAENGITGVEKAQQLKPNLILCDVMMPQLDGFGVMKILNRDSDLNHIPLIFLTAKAEKTDFRKGMGLGASDYITKPFDDTDLLDAIEIRLKQSEKIQATFNKSDQGLQRFFSEAKATEQLEKLTLDKEIRKYQTKDIIYEEGQIARWLFFIISGKVKAYQSNEYGKELTTHLYKAGDFFGYFPLLTETKYNNSSACLEETVIRLIPKNDFSLLLFNNRDFAAQFIKMLANEAENIEQQLIDLAYGSVRKKVANALLAFLKSQNANPEESNVIKVSREELAASAGTAKETLIRTLSNFKQEKLIEIQGRSITVFSVSNLENLIS